MIKVVTSKKGFGLIAAIFILVLLSSLSAFLISSSSAQRHDSNNDFTRTQLKFIALGTLDQFMYLARVGSLPASCGNWTQSGSASGPTSYTMIGLRSTPTIKVVIPCATSTANTSAGTFNGMYYYDAYALHYDPPNLGYNFIAHYPIYVTVSVGTFGSGNYISYQASSRYFGFWTSCAAWPSPCTGQPPGAYKLQHP